jgi:hypothetical protein
MADFGLPVVVTDKASGSPVVGATCTGTVAAMDAQNNVIPAVTDATGTATISVINLTVTAPGYDSYVNQPYRRPSLEAPVAVSLQRSAPIPATAES